MSRFLLFTFYFLLFTFYSKSQNLVPNWSFEIYSSCPNSSGQIDKAVPWFQPIVCCNTSEYYNQCNNGFFGVPNNYNGSQQSKTGDAYAGIIFYSPGGGSNENYREYIEVRLTDSLKAGKKYCVSFYVSLAGPAKYAVDAAGVFFSKDSVLLNSVPPFLISSTPQIKNPKGNMLSDTLNWMLISDTLISQGGEQFITIGNFNPDSTTTLLDVGGTGSSYYYIDDVSVIPCDSGVGIRELTDKEEKFKLYPNPNNGTMQFDYVLENNEDGKLIIYDLTGKAILEYELYEGVNTLSVSEGALKNGMYFYKVFLKNRIIVSEKLIIIR